MIGSFGRGTLKKINVNGGTAATICDAPDGRGGNLESRRAYCVCTLSETSALSQVVNPNVSPVWRSHVERSLIAGRRFYPMAGTLSL